MNAEELKTTQTILYDRRRRRDIGRYYDITYAYGEAVDPCELVEAMGAAYEVLCNGVHNNVQQWHEGDGPLLQKVITPTVYINGVVTSTKTEFLVRPLNSSGNKQQPEFVQTYIETRDAVYEELLQEAVRTNDFDLLLDMIITYRESTLARRLINKLNAKANRKDYAYALVGHADRIQRQINMSNRNIQNIKNASGTYAIDKARREQLFELRRKLNSDESGVLQALSVGIAVKFGRPRSQSKWRRILLENQLKAVADFSSVPEQLIKLEEMNLPITEPAVHQC